MRLLKNNPINRPCDVTGSVSPHGTVRRSACNSSRRPIYRSAGGGCNGRICKNGIPTIYWACCANGQRGRSQKWISVSPKLWNTKRSCTLRIYLTTVLVLRAGFMVNWNNTQMFHHVHRFWNKCIEWPPDGLKYYKLNGIPSMLLVENY